MAHICNPTYFRSRDQEDHGSNPAQANSSQDPIFKNTNNKIHKTGLVDWLKW
jgi:hypothetical protein